MDGRVRGNSPALVLGALFYHQWKQKKQKNKKKVFFFAFETFGPIHRGGWPLSLVLEMKPSVAKSVAARCRSSLMSPKVLPTAVAFAI